MHDMTVGQIVDYCIEYNNMHNNDKKDKGEARRATQADWDAFWG